MWVNGTRTQNATYNAANQVTSWSYDAAGNLLNDGSQTYRYDALGRVLTVDMTSNQYNADGTLVAQTQSSVTTRYVQDLATPLSQILSDGTQRFVYGSPAERLFAQQGSSARTWYSVDALGSVRATLNDAGIPQAVATYDSWGVPETAAIAPFGFTGELQRGSDVWLRARWYGAGRGGFASRDPYRGSSETPYSLMPYQYAYANPVVLRDPSGWKVSNNDVQVTFAETPDPVPVLPFKDGACPYISEDTITLHLTDLGIIIGRSENGIAGLQDLSSAKERVYDLFSFSRADFDVSTLLPDPKRKGVSMIEGLNLNIVGVGVSFYSGGFTGLSRYPTMSALNYKGIAYYLGASVQTPFDLVSFDGTGFVSQDGRLWGSVTGLSLGVSIWPFPLSFKGGMTNAEPFYDTFRNYRDQALPPVPWNWHSMVIDLQNDLFFLSPRTYVRAYMVVRENAQEWQKFDDWRQHHPGRIWRKPPS